MDIPPESDPSIPRYEDEESLHNTSTTRDLPNTRQFPPVEAAIPIARETETDVTDGVAWQGRYVGPYRVERKLSKGGMGTVLLAWDDALRRRVALKVMDPKLLADGDALRRFEREARASAAAQHPNIAQVFLVGLSEEGLPFLAMEYVDGGSLMDAIRHRLPLTYTQVATVMEQVGSALQSACKLNIIHRDIKPANIMLTKDMNARVVDFGLAKIFFEDSYRTIEGMVLGTPSYMAPEQGQGRVVDHRADIYSFGATFYHLITGRLPFNADTPVQIMMKHVTAPLVPMRSVNPQVPIEFDEIIGRCMRKDVDERYQDYESLLVDVKRVRLMCHSREQGSVIGDDGRVRGGQPSGVASSMIPAPPAAPGSRPSGVNPLPPPQRSSSASVRVREAAGRTSLEQPAQAEEGGWTPVRLAIVGAAILLVVGGVVAAVLSSKKEEPEEPPKRAKAIAEMIQRATNRANGDGEAVNDFLALNGTKDILASLRDGLLAHQTEKMALPEDLRDVATESRVIINFEKDEAGYPLDAWGNTVSYDGETGELRSAGMDGNFLSSDDLVLPLEGQLVVPSQYDRIEVKPN